MIRKVSTKLHDANGRWVEWLLYRWIQNGSSIFFRDTGDCHVPKGVSGNRWDLVDLI